MVTEFARREAPMAATRQEQYQHDLEEARERARADAARLVDLCSGRPSFAQLRDAAAAAASSASWLAGLAAFLL